MRDRQPCGSVIPPIRYDEVLHERVVTNLAGHPRRVVDAAGRRHAAVAPVLVGP